MLLYLKPFGNRHTRAKALRTGKCNICCFALVSTGLFSEIRGFILNQTIGPANKLYSILFGSSIEFSFARMIKFLASRFSFCLLYD